MTSKPAVSGLAWVLVGLSLTVALFGVTLFTKLGQLLNLPSSWLYAIHPYLGWGSLVLNSNRAMQ